MEIYFSGAINNYAKFDVIITERGKGAFQESRHSNWPTFNPNLRRYWVSQFSGCIYLAGLDDGEEIMLKKANGR